MTAPVISLELLSSDEMYEREVLKLDPHETEEDLNNRVIQTAIEAGVSDFAIARCIGTAIVPLHTNTAHSSIMTNAIYSPQSRASVATQSTAPTSNLSVISSGPPMTTTRPSHRKEISISSLFGSTKDSTKPSFDSGPTSLDSLEDTRRMHGRDEEQGSRPSRGLRKFSLGFKRDASPADTRKMLPRSGVWKESTDLKPVNGGIRTILTGRLGAKDLSQPFIVESEMTTSRAPSIITECGTEREGLRAKSANIWKKRGRRNSQTRSLNGNGTGSWSSTDVSMPVGLLAVPILPMSLESQEDGSCTSLQAMLASSPNDEPQPLRPEMKTAMHGRPYISVQAMNRGELRRLKVFRDKQLLALATAHEIERAKMTSVFDQQEELINAKYRQAMNQLNEDRSILAELDLLAALDDRLKKELARLRHMEAYCSPTSGRVITAQNLRMLQNQRDVVDRLQSDKFSQDSLNHLREQQEHDNAQLPKQQQVELQDLNAKRDRAMRIRDELEMQEVRELNGIIRRRRDASVARSNVRLEGWRLKVEAEQQRELPGPLPYLRTEEVFESFWMVDVPLASQLDDLLPWNEKKNGHSSSNAFRTTVGSNRKK